MDFAVLVMLVQTNLKEIYDTKITNCLKPGTREIFVCDRLDADISHISNGQQSD